MTRKNENPEGTLFEALRQKLMAILLNAHRVMFGNACPDYLVDWYKSFNKDEKMRLLPSILGSKPSAIVADIYYNTVVPRVINILLNGRFAIADKVTEIRNCLLHHTFSDIVFRVYYEPKYAEELYNALAKELNMKTYREIPFSKLTELMGGLKVNETIDFYTRKDSEKDRFTAFHINLGGKDIYGIHHLTDVDIATMCNGADKIHFQMLAELMDYYGCRFVKFYNNGKPDPTVYVLD